MSFAQKSVDKVLRALETLITAGNALLTTINSSLVRSTTITEYSKTMTDADTEYSQALPAGTKKITLSCRDGTAFRFAFATGKVATPTDPFQTIQANQTLHFNELSLTGVTIYVGCAGAGKVAEIIAWT